MTWFRTLLAIALCSMASLGFAGVAPGADVAPAVQGELGEARSLDQLAMEAYRAQDYKSAGEQWERELELEAVRASSNERARILHNLGNVSLRSGRTLESVARYSSSLKLRPRDAGTLANLDFARSEAALDPAKRVSFLGSLTLREMERLVMFLAFALFLMLVGEAFIGGAFKPAAVVTALLLLASLVPWASQRADTANEEAMVVKSAGTSLRSEPRAGATSLTMLAAGTEHLVRDRLTEWVAVETADGVEGWVKAADLLRTTY